MGDSRFACCLQGGGVYVSSGTVAITSSSITGNTAGVYVRAKLPTFKSSHRPLGKLLTHAPRLTLAQLRTLRSTTAGTCRRELENFPWPQWETHVFARCLQGGGVAVFGGTVTISSCTISGNTAFSVRARSSSKVPSPDGKVADVLAPTHTCTTANASVNYRG